MISHLPPVLQLILLIVTVLAGIHDLRSRRIPNWLVLTALFLGFGMNLFLYEGAGLRASLLGMGLALLVYFPLYVLHAMGAGDVKLMAAVGSIIGPGNWLVLFIITALLGGVCAVLLLLFKGRLGEKMWNVGWILSEMTHLRAPYQSSEELDVRSSKAVRLAHGAVIAFGSVVFLIAHSFWAR